MDEPKGFLLGLKPASSVINKTRNTSVCVANDLKIDLIQRVRALQELILYYILVI
jgi:hypothetical protein